MNDTIEEFKIHDDGICNFCHSYDEEKFSYTEDQIDINLENIKKKLDKK
tara:strand:+ start:500 stop:646 length:147 start_codon:yes stop_codon:yes gene_type:complete